MRDMIRSDVMGEAAGRAHAAAFGTDKKAALALDCARRTATRYRAGGHPAARRFAEYVTTSPHPEQLVAFARSLLREHVAGMTRDALVSRYREALLEEPGLEATDRLHDLDGSTWEVRADASRADAAVGEIKEAIEIEFAARSRREPRLYSPEAIDREVRNG